MCFKELDANDTMAKYASCMRLKLNLKLTDELIKCKYFSGTIFFRVFGKQTRKMKII